MGNYSPSQITTSITRILTTSGSNPNLANIFKNPPPSSVIGALLGSENGSSDPSAISPHGAVGLGQVLPSTAIDVAKRYGISIPTGDGQPTKWLQDPENNLLISTAYMAELWNSQPTSVTSVGDAARSGYLFAQYKAGPEAAKGLLKDSLVDGRISSDKFVSNFAKSEWASKVGAGNPQSAVNSLAKGFKVDTVQVTSSGNASDRYADATKSGLTAQAANFSVDPNTFLENAVGKPYSENKQILDLQDSLAQGLEVLPWYQDSTLLTSNPNLKIDPDQMYFQVFTDDKLTTMLRDSKGNPISVRMYVNIDKLTERSGHTIGRGTTKTGFEVDLWGQELDEISGSGSTGLFMNSFGLTALPSFARNSDLAKVMVDMYLEAYKVQRSMSTGRKDTWDWMDNLKTGFDTKLQSSLLTSAKLSYTNQVRNELITKYKQAGLDPKAYQTQINEGITRLVNMRYGKAATALSQGQDLRVGAQDAFVEMLMLFKNNGTTRFLPSDVRYTGVGGGSRQKLSDATWSAKMGTTLAQANARANDIMRQGGVLFKRRNVAHIGVFKTFSFVMDAEKPFSWNYQFSFTVQKTVRINSLPWAKQLNE